MSTTQNIDPVQFGRMLSAMERLTVELERTSQTMSAMDNRIEFLESRYAIGKWGVGGLVLMMGFAVFGVKETLYALWRAIAG